MSSGIIPVTYGILQSFTHILVVDTLLPDEYTDDKDTKLGLLLAPSILGIYLAAKSNLSPDLKNGIFCGSCLTSLFTIGCHWQNINKSSKIILTCGALALFTKFINK